MSSKPVQYELDMEDWYALCRIRPDAFAHYYFKHILRSPSSEFHFLLYSLIKKISETPYPNNIAIAAPRGNAKTQIINMILPIWCAAFELKKFIVIMSETSRHAEANLESIKFELTTNELLAEHFPHLVGEGKTWRKEVIDTSNDIRIIAVGSGKQVRGSQKKGGHRPDLILCHPRGTSILGCDKNIDVSELCVGDKVYNHNWEEDEIIAWKPYTWTGDYYKFKLYGHPEEIEATAGHQFFVRKKAGKKYARTGKIMKCLDRGKWKRNQYECLSTYAEPKKLNVREIEKGDMVGYKINTKTIPIEEIARKENWIIYEPGGEIRSRDSKGRIVEGSEGSYRPVDISGKEWWLASKEFWWLAGVFLGDGTVDRKTGYSTRFSCNPLETGHIDKIIRSIEFLGNTPSKIREKTVISIQLSNRLINYIFNQWKREKNSHKVPTRNIEFLDPELQKELILGYIAADGWISKKQGVKITSVCFELLEFMQRILLRQGIVSSIRNGIKGGEVKIFDRIINTQDKYDLYFKQDAWKLNLLPEPKSKRRLNKMWFIEDGTVWRKVKDVSSEYKTDIVFPFKVKDGHSYLTTQFYSQNCDDLSSDEMVRTKKRRDDHEDWFRKAVMGMEGTSDTKMDIIVTGTILHPHCILSKLLDPKIFAGWESHKYQAVYKFSDSPLWKTWEHLYTNYEDEKREETAHNFFKAHEKEMLEGTQVLWPEGDGYYKLMVYKIKAGPKAFFCFDGTTNILLDDYTHKTIADIKIGDKVITHDGSAQRVIDTYSRYTESSMYKIKIAGMPEPIKVTEEHPFLIWPKISYGPNKLSHQHLNIKLANFQSIARYNTVQARILENNLTWQLAKDLVVGDAFVQPVPPLDVKPHECDLDWWWLVGYYLAEGYINYSNNTIGFVANVKEIPYLNKVITICKKFGYGRTYTIREGSSISKSVAVLYICSKELVSRLRIFGRYSYGKFLPKSIDSICRECFNSLWEGYICGDGYDIKTYKGVNSTSYKLLVGFQKNWLKFGNICYLYKMKDYGTLSIRNKTYRTYPLWSLQKIEGKRARQAWIYKGLLYSKIQRIEKIETGISSLVYGISVNKNKTYCVPGAVVKNSEKMNNPVDPSQVLFDPQRIVYFDRRDIDLDKLIIYGAIDPASGDAKRQGDLSAVVTIGRDPKSGIIYVLDVMAAARGPSECIKYIKRVHELYEYRKFGVDQDALKMLKDFIEKDIPDLQGRLTLYDLRLPKPKRIDRLEPIIHSGLLRFQRNQQEAVEELTFYPNSEHDDVLDALEIAVRLTGHRGYRLLTY